MRKPVGKHTPKVTLKSSHDLHIYYSGIDDGQQGKVFEPPQTSRKDRALYKAGFDRAREEPKL